MKYFPQFNLQFITHSIVLTTLVFVSSFAKAQATTSNEYQVVVETAYNYFNGAARGDQSLLAKSFDLEFGHVKMITLDKESGQESIRTVPLKEFAGYFKKATKDDWKAKVLSVDIVDNKMAMVKLDFDTPKNHYLDYLVMYKRNQNWKIVSKTFVAKAK